MDLTRSVDGTLWRTPLWPTFAALALAAATLTVCALALRRTWPGASPRRRGALLALAWLLGAVTLFDHAAATHGAPWRLAAPSAALRAARVFAVPLAADVLALSASLVAALVALASLARRTRGSVALAALSLLGALPWMHQRALVGMLDLPRVTVVGAPFAHVGFGRRVTLGLSHRDGSAYRVDAHRWRWAPRALDVPTASTPVRVTETVRGDGDWARFETRVTFETVEPRGTDALPLAAGNVWRFAVRTRCLLANGTRTDTAGDEVWRVMDATVREGLRVVPLRVEDERGRWAQTIPLVEGRGAVWTRADDGTLTPALTPGEGARCAVAMRGGDGTCRGASTDPHDPLAGPMTWHGTHDRTHALDLVAAVFTLGFAPRHVDRCEVDARRIASTSAAR